MKTKTARGIRTMLLCACAGVAIAACGQQGGTQTVSNEAPAAEAPRPAGDEPVNQAGGSPLIGMPQEEEYGEFVARAEELVNVSTNDIAKSIRLSAISLALGRIVYDKNCASCHGADLKGSKEAHAPDLSDNQWRYSGDDHASGGETKLASDVEWTVRYGVRSGSPNARGLESDMLAFDPQYRNEHDIGDYGRVKTVDDKEIEELAEYVLQLSGQRFDRAKATRGQVLFLDNAKGNCADCHTDEGVGNAALGSTDLTRKEVYLWGSDKASIIESITKGRRGEMPGFDKILKPEELKAVSVFVFSQAEK
jgi:cbb3-type cytochrome c oxidase subunit III